MPVPASRELRPSVVLPEEILDLPAHVACPACRVELGEEFALGGTEADGGTPGALAGVVRTADGLFAAVFWGSVNSQIYIYDARGRFDSVFGTEGSGPGEFRSIGNSLFADGSSLLAFDSDLGRLARIDVRSRQMTTTPWVTHNVMNAAFPGDGKIVLSGRVPGAEEGLPLHVFSDSGDWARSFGRREPLEDLSDTWALERMLAAAADDTFWAAPSDELLLEHWTVEGERLQAFSAARERFVPFVKGSWVLGDKSSRVLGIAVGPDGLLRLLYNTPVVDWEEAVVPIPDSEINPLGGPRFQLAPGHRAHDYYLEIIDPEAGVVLARSTLPGLGFYQLADANTLIRGWDDPDSGTSMLAATDFTFQR